MKIADITEGTADVLRSAGAFAHDLVRPTVRLGITGLARSGKTVFITSFIQNLIAGGRLPFFDAVAQGRIARAYLEPQPDDRVPRFEYEQHLEALTADPPRWPESTRRLSQLRVTLEYEPRGLIRRSFGSDTLHVDIVDYPGEWLLDLPLLHLSFVEWSHQAVAQSQEPARRRESREWRVFLDGLDPLGPADETTAVTVAKLFTAYLRANREQESALSTVPPGRFLMPGDMEGSPALTFSPLTLPQDRSSPPSGSLWAMMARRFESYKAHVVKPFFRDHFARLDRQVVLVDALAAINGGADAIQDLERTLAAILQCFRPGSRSWLSSILFRRIDRILFAATKADHLHHTSHNQLEAIMAHITRGAIERAQFSGAEVKVLALAAVRATREGQARQNGETLPCILGTPLEGERIGRRVFDGEEEFAIFPGDLPDDPEDIGRAKLSRRGEAAEAHFVRFRPPALAPAPTGGAPALPHIRLDRAMNFLLGDRLQ